MGLEIIPTWIKKTFPQLIWELPTVEKTVYLTFDDGPTPEITPQVLALLSNCQIKGTFFCLGAQAEKYPRIIELLKTNGHKIANHGYQHLNGFFSSTKKYIQNAQQGAQITQSRIFRPPYGKITPWQAHQINKEFQIVMWSIMSMDFHPKLKPEQCFCNIVKNIFPGAIIVFHDTEKASKNLLNVLPLLSDYLNEKQYKAIALPF